MIEQRNRGNNPSNADIMRAIQDVQNTQKTQQVSIDTLLTWKAGVEAVDRYIARKATAEVTTPPLPPIDWPKIIIAILGVTGALVAIIGVLVKQ